MVHVITHRGLEPARGATAHGESTLEAFEDQLRRGFGIEFDPNPCADGWAVWHDGALTRLTGGADTRAITTVPLAEVAGRAFGNGRLGTLDEVLSLVARLGSVARPSALHLKGERQAPELLASLGLVLQRHPEALAKLFVFDVREPTARALRAAFPGLLLAPSVAHSYDIQRYNGAVHGTLWSLEAALAAAAEGLFDWAWVDEWDLAAPGGGQKAPFAAEATFRALRGAGLKVGLVTPELHATSPGLLGGEAHEDSSSRERLLTRIQGFATCGLVDAICTDFPDDTAAFASA